MIAGGLSAWTRTLQKRALEEQHCDPAIREPFIAALSSARIGSTLSPPRTLRPPLRSPHRQLAQTASRGRLLTRLLSEPFVEHGSREANVPADPMTGQAAGPHGLVDPARPDVEIPSGLIWPKQPVLLQRSLCCWCCCFHAGIDPNAAEPANGFFRRTLGPPHDLACQHGLRRRPETSPGDRRTTAGERCRERCPAVATS